MTSSTLTLPKDHAKLQLPNGKEMDFIFVDGYFVGFLFQLAQALGETLHTTYLRYSRLLKRQLAPNYYGINYQKKMTWDRLVREFTGTLPVTQFPKAPTFVLLREDDLIFLASKSTTSKDADLITKYLIDYALKARNWISDFIFKLGKCNNREFLFLCAWLRLGYALEEIVPQQWYRLPDTTRRVDFRLFQGEMLVEIDAKGLDLHDPLRDKSTDRVFFQKGKIVIRFMNAEIDANPLKCVRETIDIAKSKGIPITQQVLPTFVKGFVLNNA